MSSSKDSRRGVNTAVVVTVSTRHKNSIRYMVAFFILRSELVYVFVPFVRLSAAHKSDLHPHM